MISRTSWMVLGCGAALFGVTGWSAIGCGGVDTGGVFNSGSAGTGGSSSKAASSGGPSSASSNASSSAGQGGMGSPASSSSTGGPPVCGDGKVDPGEECDDGNAVDGDGCSPTCKSEGTTCANALYTPIGIGTTTLSGSTVGGGTHAGAGCHGSGGPDRVFRLLMLADGFFTVNLPRSKTSYDSVLYVSQACVDNGDIMPLVCADSYDPQNAVKLHGGEVTSIEVAKNDIYYVFVDGFAQSDSGTYTINFDLSTGLDCNDPVPIPLEPGTPMTLLGSNGNAPAGQGSCGGAPGGQVVYQITRPDNAGIKVDTDPAYTNYNAVLYARTACGDANSEIACSNQPANGMESINFNATAAVPTFVWVDGSQAGGGMELGTYRLVLTP